MLGSYRIFNFNTFLKTVELKKQYLKKLKNKVTLLKYNKENNYKNLTNNVLNKLHTNGANNYFLVMYIISIFFSKTNTLLHVMDFSGKLKFFYSAGYFKYSGKSKRARSFIFKKFYRVLFSKLKFLRNKPISLHLVNVGSNKLWVIKKLKCRFFIKSIKSFNSYPYNGCRKKKPRRIKRRRKKLKRWLSGLKRQTVNLLSISSQVRILLSSKYIEI